MSRYDTRRDPRETMGTSVAQNVENRSGMPGTSNWPMTSYPQSQSENQAHLLRGRIIAAHRNQILIDADSGTAMDARMNAATATAVAGIADPGDSRMAARERAHGTAVGAFARFDRPSEDLGGGVRMARPTDTVKHLFGVDDGSTR